MHWVTVFTKYSQSIHKVFSNTHNFVKYSWTISNQQTLSEQQCNKNMQISMQAQHTYIREHTGSCHSVIHTLSAHLFTRLRI